MNEGGSERGSHLQGHKAQLVGWNPGQFCTFTFMHLADAFIQIDFQERALQKSIGH